MSTVAERQSTTSEPAVRVSAVTHMFGEVVALDGVSIDVRTSEFLTLLGPSGSGKSTLLRIIAGLTRPRAGAIWIDGKDVTRARPQERDVGFVFQNYALFPHLSVFENVAYPLRIRHIKGDDVHSRVEAALARVNLPTVGARLPSQLSGGQQQRVAVARALVYEPAVLLLDEPLGALDRKLRKHMQTELRQLQQDLGLTCIYVTHDQEEALTMSDRIVVMRDGHIRQVGRPTDIYREPADSFVADFVGDTNLFHCAIERQGERGVRLRTELGTQVDVKQPPTGLDGSHCYIAVRPEFVRDSATGQLDVAFKGHLEKVVFSGNVTDVTYLLENGERLISELPGDQARRLELGSAASVGWNYSDMNILPE